jgi:GNAT superfamily N-acetyltransferase
MLQAPVRQAIPADAPRICVLYEEAYKPPGGGKASDHYPFPQILKPQWVAQALADGWVHWVVAEHNGHIVGSAAAVRNIGSDEDQVAEVFGIVVRKEEHRKGHAKRLLAGLCEGLDDRSRILLCESRTALAAGWKVARGGGFNPLGFEPFAHHTPAGSEAMLMTGRIHPHALATRVTDTPLPLVQSLAETILGSQTAAIASRPDPGIYPLHGQTWAELAPACRRFSKAQSEADIELHTPVTVCQDDQSGKRLIEESDAKYRHRSGVIAFRRFEGNAPQRYDRQYHVVRAGGHALAAALVVHDRVDQRTRILDLRTTYEGLQGVLLAIVVATLIKQVADRQLVIVIDVCANAFKIQNVLSALGFCPTIYYPSLIAQGDTRIDGIQYTCLVNCEFKDSLKHPCVFDDDSLKHPDKHSWLPAITVIKAVQSCFSRKSDAMHGTR